MLPDLSPLRVESHPQARSKAVAEKTISAGSTIISVPSLVTVLLDSEKGRRCDYCQVLQSHSRPLQRCTRCAAYWYCGETCQRLQWEQHHKRICKAINTFVADNQYQSLPSHKKLDSLLLSHLVACMASSQEKEGSPLDIFLSLLPGPNGDADMPPICGNRSTVPAPVVRSLYSHFGNNNFSVHSHLTTIGHGVFPLASRLFNHSCTPNAVARYQLVSEKPTLMEIVALREIKAGEEVCIPYLDPALLQSRHQIFELSYEFKCDCPSCKFIGSLGRIPSPPTDLATLSAVGEALRSFSGLNDPLASTLPEVATQREIPTELRCVFHESYMASLSESFSRLSHDGPYNEALDVGMTLLALYLLVYPTNYPQIGMHLLEMAKTAWNMIASSTKLSGDIEKQLTARALFYLESARDVLKVYGPEGDKHGPLEEIHVLEDVLESPAK